MDSKLKSLKVADLKDIISKAGISAPAKATKQDLISRITASQQAIDVYNQLYPSETAKAAPPPPGNAANDDLLAPLEEPDWEVDDTTLSKPAATNVSVPNETAPAVSSEKPSTEASTAPAPEDDEETAKRKARAARFNIPYVEPKPAAEKKAAGGRGRGRGAGRIAPAGVAEDPEKQNSRAARFGLPTTTTSTVGQKRSTPSDSVDEGELERRKKRAERFGLKTA